MKQEDLIAGLARKVLDAKGQTDKALEGWNEAIRAVSASVALGYEPAVAGATGTVEAYRAEWQRARDVYLEALEVYFEVASGAFTDEDDVETRIEATTRAIAYLRRAS